MKNMTLRIENVSTLERNDAACLQLSGNSARVGRNATMDWILPDPTRNISGHHFDVSYEGTDYVLYDVSKNGIFLHGDRHRLSGPRVLQQRDRFYVGSYTISVELSEKEASVAPVASSEMITRRPVALVADIGTDPEDAKPEVKKSKALQTPGLNRGSGRAASVPQRPNLASLAKAPSSEGVSPPPQFRQDPLVNGLIQAPSRSSGIANAASAPAGSAPKRELAPVVAKPVIAAETPQPAAALPPAKEDGQGTNFLQAFLDGAGVQDPSELQLPSEDLARMLGRCVREATEEMMQMLQSRAAVKLFMSEQDRTMLLAAGNNPMKFMLDADSAFKTMFLDPRDGYMDGADGFKNALADIRHHQDAVVAALQPALAEMLEGLSPDDIEVAVGRGLFGGSSGKFWKEYKTRWEATASQGENGMLDAFINAFSRHYADALRNT